MTEGVEEYHARVQKLRAELHAARRPPGVDEIEKAFNGKKSDGSA